MSDFDSKDYSQQGNSDSDFAEPSEEMLAEQDLLMEHIIDNLNNTPVGQVLKKLAALPEVSRQKVMNMRQQLTSGGYDLNERLDIVLDKVLEELTT